MPRPWFLFLKNMLLIVTFMLVSYTTLTVAITALTRFGVGAAFMLSLEITLFIWIIGFLLNWLRDRAKASEVYLDAGRHPQWWLFLLLAASALSLDLGDFSSSSSSTSFFSSWLELLSVAFLASFALGRLQIYECGIWDYWGFTPWQEIRAYAWKDDTTLVLAKKGWFSFYRGELIVAPKHKAAFEKQLLEHVGQAATYS